jgi:hypothetical protein
MPELLVWAGRQVGATLSDSRSRYKEKRDKAATRKAYPQITQITQIGKAYRVRVFHPNAELPLTQRPVPS